MCYHLISIIIPALSIPIELKYLNEILNSFNTHYGINLLDAKPTPHTFKMIFDLLGVECPYPDVNPFTKIEPKENS
jgi:hypothetical protein